MGFTEQKVLLRDVISMALSVPSSLYSIKTLGYVMLYNFNQGLHSLLRVLGEISIKGNLVYISSAATWHVLLVFIAYTYCLLEY